MVEVYYGGLHRFVEGAEILLQGFGVDVDIVCVLGWDRFLWSRVAGLC